MKKEKPEFSIVKSAKSTCKDCHGTGQVLYQPIGEHEPHKVRCQCCDREPAIMRIGRGPRQPYRIGNSRQEKWLRGMMEAKKRREDKLAAQLKVEDKA